MTDLKGWCLVKTNGWIEYKASHVFMPYETWLLKTIKYKCKCGIRIHEDEYTEYAKFLTARRKICRTNLTL